MWVFLFSRHPDHRARAGRDRDRRGGGFGRRVGRPSHADPVGRVGGIASSLAAGDVWEHTERTGEGDAGGRIVIHI